ncbi:MAG: hypothetical protein ABIR24_09795 [Verrucomicrobiota bacterium]
MLGHAQVHQKKMQAAHPEDTLLQRLEQNAATFGYKLICAPTTYTPSFSRDNVIVNQLDSRVSTLSRNAPMATITIGNRSDTIQTVLSLPDANTHVAQRRKSNVPVIMSQ